MFKMKNPTVIFLFIVLCGNQINATPTASHVGTVSATPTPASHCDCDERISIAMALYQQSVQNLTQSLAELTLSVTQLTATITKPTTPTPLHCGDGYIYSNVTSHCYKLHTQKVKWVDAKSKCLEEGATLAVPNSKEEAHLLADIATAVIPDWTFIHIGMYRVAGTNLWKTITDENVSDSGYNVWSPGKDQWIGKDWTHGKLRSDATLQPGVYSYGRPYICEKIY